MATSAVGPGFITQTTVFTNQFLYDFGFVILASVIIDIIVQLNIWRIIMVSQENAATVAGRSVKGGGMLLALLVVSGGIVFNIGNISGCGLALEALAGIDVKTGAAVSAILAVGIFLIRTFLNALDNFTKVLGLVMIGIVLFIAFTNMPPILPMVEGAFIPGALHANPILTLVGGTVGGYISFAGAHRMLDASGGKALPVKAVDKQAVTGIILSSIVRIGLFAAVLGVIVAGFSPDATNPAAAIFEKALGINGRRVFGIILWCAAITSVVGASYTCVSFLSAFGSWAKHKQRWLIITFILISGLLFLLFGKPVRVLVLAGAVNALVLPAGLGLLLLSKGRLLIEKHYKHPLWLVITGWIVVAAVCWMAWLSFSAMM